MNAAQQRLNKKHWTIFQIKAVIYLEAISQFSTSDELCKMAQSVVASPGVGLHHIAVTDHLATKIQIRIRWWQITQVWSELLSRI